MNGWVGYGSFIHVVVCLILAAVVYFKNPSRRLNVSYAIWTFALALWGVAYFILQATRLNIDALLITRISFLGAVLFPAAYLHFSFVQIKKDHHDMATILAAYGASLLFAVAVWTPWFFNEGSSARQFSPGIFYHGFVAYYFVTTVLVISTYLRQIKQETTRPALKQLKTNFLGCIVAYLGFSFAVGSVYVQGLPLVLGGALLTLYAMLMASGTLSTRMWQGEFVVRQMVVLMTLGAFFLASYFGVNGLLDFLVGTSASTHKVIAALSAFFVGYFLYSPIEKYVSDQVIFQKKYKYQKLLKDASRGMSNIKSLEHLTSLVVHFMTMKMNVTNAAILSKDKETEAFFVQKHRGCKGLGDDFLLPKDDALIEFLNFEKESIDTENLDEYIALNHLKKTQGKSVREYDFEAIKRTLKKMNAVCCVPSFLGRELKQILILGEKKTGDFYTEADLTILYTIAQESAIALENAGLFDEAFKKTGELGQINEQLEYSKSLLMKALNETEVANKQLQDTQAQLIHEQKMATLGRLAASVGHEVNNPLTILSMNVSRVILKYRKDSDLRVGDILSLFTKMEQNIGRIKAVVNTLTGLLKRSEKGKFSPLSLKLILEETLPLVQFQTYLDNLTGTEVEFDIPGNIPLVRGDLERLQEVFLNLFINAYHAMAGKRNRRIQVKAEVDSQNSKFLAIHFIDNGSGMPEETRKKIFNYGFTTKGPGRGSGLGLYMCKYIIELHGGDIRVESEMGVGTSFILTLPTYEEESTGSGSGGMQVEASQ